jgi:hypothetical protein
VSRTDKGLAKASEWGENATSYVLGSNGELNRTPHNVHALPNEPALRGCRDRDLLIYIACRGVVAIDHVMSWLVVGRTAAYRRVSHCVEAGLIERLELLRTEPSLLRVTRKGLRYLGLDALPVAEVTPATAPHWLRCASVARHLYETEFRAHEIWSERDIRLAESGAGQPIASAKVGELPIGGPRYHRPDLAIVNADGVVAVEVELSLKAPRRLQAILRGWRRAHWVAEVRYYAAPGPVTRGLERAVAKTHTAEKVRILEVPPRAWSEQASLQGGAQGASQSGSSATEAKTKAPESGDPSRSEQGASRCSR